MDRGRCAAFFQFRQSQDTDGTMIKNFSSALLSIALSIFASAQTPPHFDGQTWWDYIKVIADDKMENISQDIFHVVILKAIAL